MTDLLIHAPLGAQQLILLLHGYGSDAADLAPLGKTLVRAFPHAYVVSLEAPDWGEQGLGRQWYSLLGLDESQETGEHSRAHRVEQGLPSLAQRIGNWQSESGVSHLATLLLGFSQGASMALAYAASEYAVLTPPARVVSLSGRMVGWPEKIPEATTLHWIHGKLDEVIAYEHCVQASEHLIQIGADLTTDVLPHTGHEVSAQVQRTLLHRLQNYIPKRVWQAALAASDDINQDTMGAVPAPSSQS
jgi:phospholipase/carboxylesterase